MKSIRSQHHAAHLTPLEEGFEFEFRSSEPERIVVDEIGLCTTFLVDESPVHGVDIRDLKISIFVSDGAVFCREVWVCDDDITVSCSAKDIFSVIDPEILSTMISILRDDPSDNRTCFFA